MENPDSHALRRLPRVDDLLALPELVDPAAGLDRRSLRRLVRDFLDTLRAEIKAGAPLPPPAELRARLARALEAGRRPSLVPVVNATGVVLHTGLGRAVLAPAAIQAIARTAAAYNNLELDLASGERGLRHSHVAELLGRLTGAEAALVVNNNAGAVLLSLMALARGREAIVSRGELVEIGGGFRVPEVMAQSGAVLREVGTTNKTYLADYRAAIGAETALLMKVHPSNFRVVGFQAEVELAELAALGREHGLPVLMDLGSGTLVPLTEAGEAAEPTVAETLAAGADLVTFSGDKLLGGPQAGLIVGRRDLVERIGKHPLMRALRPGKLTLAALEATLRLYLDEGRARRKVPVLAAIGRPPAELARRAAGLARLIRRRLGEQIEATVRADVGRVGGGALPLAELPSPVVALTPARIPVEELARRLRCGDPAVLGRTQGGALLLAVRTLLPGDAARIVAALEAALAE